MAENSNIEWTDHTFNPWIGCQKVGPGCDHCYAEAWDARGLQGQATRWGPDAQRTRTGAANWQKPHAWNRAAAKAGKRARVFCASLADVFDNHPSILPEWRADLWSLIGSTPHLDWLLLTKRPGNIQRFLPIDSKAAWYRPWNQLWPWPNVWIGCTVVNQDEADRDIPKLLAVPARIRFLSIEPMLGPIDLTAVKKRDGYAIDALAGVLHDFGVPFQDAPGKLHWIICGGESGLQARPMHPDWARSLRDQCQTAGVAFHFKQWGEWRETDGPKVGISHRAMGAGTHWLTRDGQLIERGARTFSIYNDYQVARLGKKAAGRLLDGRTWDEVPHA